jgi:histidinol-phosphate aminotransferase
LKFWNSKLKNSTEYIPGEQPGDVDTYIKLNTNENPFPPSKAVLDALRNSCNESLRRYPDPEAKDLRSAFAAKNGLKAENVFVGNGSDEIFSLIFRGFIEGTQTAAFPYPSYSLYNTLAEFNGIKYETVNLGKNFEYNMDGFLKKKYSLAVIANPNNPTGTLCGIKDIKSFLGKFKGLLVIDEAYNEFYGDTALDLVEDFDNLIVTRSFSKSYSLAGLRIGLAVACSDIIKGFLKIKDSYNIDRLALAGALAALNDTKGFNYNIQMLRNNKEYMEEMLQALGFTVVPSRANFVLVKHGKKKALELYESLKEKKILVRYFTSPAVSDYIRISVGTMMEIKTLVKELSVILEA